MTAVAQYDHLDLEFGVGTMTDLNMVDQRQTADVVVVPDLGGRRPWRWCARFAVSRKRPRSTGAAPTTNLRISASPISRVNLAVGRDGTRSEWSVSRLSVVA